MCDCVIQVLNNQNTHDQIVQSIIQNIIRDTLTSSPSIILNLLLWSEQTPLLTHVIQCRIRVRPRCFINRVRPTWPGQNVTQLTWMTRPSFNLDMGHKAEIANIARLQICYCITSGLDCWKSGIMEWWNGRLESFCSHLSYCIYIVVHLLILLNIATQ